eukprot:6212146-Pleurochrysis_carterae.AAC.1
MSSDPRSETSSGHRKIVYRICRQFSCCHKNFCTSGSILNELEGHAKLILLSGCSGARIRACIWLWTTLPILPMIPGWRETRSGTSSGNRLVGWLVLNYGGTAICYSAVGSGRQGYPIQTAHVFI